MLLGSYGDENQTLEVFSQRVENVFKFQNSMTNAVMFRETESSVTVLSAEQKMRTACEPLNEYASREIEGLKVDLTLQKRVAQTAISCEKAARELEKILVVP
ncbi:MAG: hypothetical protein RL236_154 [Pseudomonadota bacterium]